MLKPEDRVKISEEVFDLILSIMDLHLIDGSKQNFKFAIALFLAGVNFIPNKTATDSKKNTEHLKG